MRTRLVSTYSAIFRRPSMGIARGSSQLIVLGTLVVVLTVGSVRFADSMRTVNRHAREYRTAEPSRRVFAGAWLLDIDREFVQASRAYVGRRDDYAVVTGANVTTSTRITLDFLVTYLRSELLPATHTAPDVADWILCFGCDRAPYSSYEPVWTREGLAVLKRPT